LGVGVEVPRGRRLLLAELPGIGRSRPRLQRQGPGRKVQKTARPPPPPKSKKPNAYSSVVSLGLHHAENCITLSPVVLKHLKRMSAAGPLKVYIYLCACYQGQPFSASIPQIKAAAGLKTRSVNTALKVLREKKLITRITGRGNQANRYAIPLPKPQETAVPPIHDPTPPSPALKPAPPPAATPTPATTPEPIPAPPSAKPGQAPAASPTPPAGTIRDLIASCYRTINAQEFAQVKQAYPDEVVLREKLERLKRKGGVGAYMEIGFFIQALTQFA
jgi:hypothetical protein